jgi:hypothetical protein
LITAQNFAINATKPANALPIRLRRLPTGPDPPLRAPRCSPNGFPPPGGALVGTGAIAAVSGRAWEG